MEEPKTLNLKAGSNNVKNCKKIIFDPENFEFTGKNDPNFTKSQSTFPGSNPDSFSNPTHNASSESPSSSSAVNPSQDFENMLRLKEQQLKEEIYRTTLLQEELFVLGNSRMSFIKELNETKNAYGTLKAEHGSVTSKMDKLAKLYVSLDDKYQVLEKKYQLVVDHMKENEGEEKTFQIENLCEKNSQLEQNHEKLTKLYCELELKHRNLNHQHVHLAKACSILDDKYNALVKSEKKLSNQKEVSDAENSADAYKTLKQDYKNLEDEIIKLKEKNTRLADELDRLRNSQTSSAASTPS
eukprot:Sdes_comp9777_c0_seq1m1302